MENCRVYICKSMFAERDECIRFSSIDEYKRWLEMYENVAHHYSFQPICGKKEIFDRMILSFRSNKLDVVNIRHTGANIFDFTQ